MYKLLVIFMLISLGSCHHAKDFSSIKSGMTSKEVVRLIGAPERRQPMGSAAWWIYNDPEKHVIIISDDTVTNCTTQEEAMKIMERNLKTFDSLKVR
jgi:hypothetical protein